MLATGLIADSYKVPSGITIIDSGQSAHISSTTPTIAFSTSPIVDDVIILFTGAITPLSYTGGVAPSGWSFAFPTGVVSAASAMTFSAIYHVVTGAEDSANTTSWSLTNAFAAARSGASVGCYLRGVNTSSVVNAYGTNAITTVVTPHDLAAVTGSGITTSGLVLRAIGRDGASAYTGVPAGHTQLITQGGTQGMWLGYMNALSTAGVNISAASITPAAADEGASITLVITPV